MASFIVKNGAMEIIFSLFSRKQSVNILQSLRFFFQRKSDQARVSYQYDIETKFETLKTDHLEVSGN